VSKIITTGKHGLEPIGDREETEAGEPVQRFRARLLRPGTFTHPTAGWTLDVDAPRLDRLRGAADAMLSAGVTIPFISEHFTTDARDTLGYVDALAVHDDWLVAEGEFIGEDAIRAATRNYVSVEIEEDVKDGDGNEFGEAITRIALTPSPVVTGQRIAAAVGAKVAAVYVMADEHEARIDPDLRQRAGRAYHRSGIAMAANTDEAIEDATAEAEALKGKLQRLTVEEIEHATEALEYESPSELLATVQEPKIVAKLAETVVALRAELAAVQRIAKGLNDDAQAARARKPQGETVAASRQPDATALRIDPDLAARSAKAHGR